MPTINIIHFYSHHDDLKVCDLQLIVHAFLICPYKVSIEMISYCDHLVIKLRNIQYIQNNPICPITGCQKKISLMQSLGDFTCYLWH